jgi:hypothetical protein
MKHSKGERLTIRFNRKIKHWSLRSLLIKLIKIGAKVLRRSRYITFKMAEVAISKELFAEILSRINRFRCCSHQ